MELKEIKKFQIIGACVQMQTISLEDEWRFIDGVPYEIDFFQDFADIYGDEPPGLIAYGRIVQEPRVRNVEMVSFFEDVAHTREIFKGIEKGIRKERKAEREWKRERKLDGYSKKQRRRNAERYFDEIN